MAIGIRFRFPTKDTHFVMGGRAMSVLRDVQNGKVFQFADGTCQLIFLADHELVSLLADGSIVFEERLAP